MPPRAPADRIPWPCLDFKARSVPGCDVRARPGPLPSVEEYAARCHARQTLYGVIPSSGLSSRYPSTEMADTFVRTANVGFLTEPFESRHGRPARRWRPARRRAAKMADSCGDADRLRMLTEVASAMPASVWRGAGVLRRLLRHVRDISGCPRSGEKELTKGRYAREGAPATLRPCRLHAIAATSHDRGRATPPGASRTSPSG